MLFWQQSLGKKADIVLSPAPIHKHHGGMIQDLYSIPSGLYRNISQKIGKPFQKTTHKDQIQVCCECPHESGHSSLQQNFAKTDDDYVQIISNLTNLVIYLSQIEKNSGKYIHIGLEPEPDCVIENTEETIRFFEQDLINKGKYFIRRDTGVTLSFAEEMIRRHLGICFDTCHLSTQFEDLTESVNRLIKINIKISKVQLSAAIKVMKPVENISALHAFYDPVYLHQIKAIHSKKGIISFPDLSMVLRDNSLLQEEYEEWRIHFHVPLYFQSSNIIETTADDLTPEFFRRILNHNIDHLEIETYTFNVLPSEMKSMGIAKSIIREFEWVINRCHEHAPFKG